MVGYDTLAAQGYWIIRCERCAGLEAFPAGRSGILYFYDMRRGTTMGAICRSIQSDHPWLQCHP